MNTFKSLIFVTLITFAGCFSTESDSGADCFGLRLTSTVCMYRTPGVAGYACSDMRYIVFDGKRLPDSEVVFDCRADDDQSTIMIVKPGVLCEEYLIGGCVK